MAFALAPFASIPLDEALLEHLIEEHETITLPRLHRLWSYYRNALAEPNEKGGSAGAPAQSAGLPVRLQNEPEPGIERDDRFRREIVIENDIAWRIQTLVDFMFPEPPRIISRARNPQQAALIESLLEAAFTEAGGAGLWQDAALLGSVFGHVDFLVDFDALTAIAPIRLDAAGQGEIVPSGHQAAKQHAAGADPSSVRLPPRLDAAARALAIEPVEATRAIPLVNPGDYQSLDAYVIHYEREEHDVDRGGMLSRLSRALRRRGAKRSRATSTVTEIISADHRQRYEDRALVHDVVNRLGRLPVVHVQNLSQPLQYSGLSDVEPLIPLQDELNTRLSDRANRVTMQSFRMWLGKGIEGFTDRPVGPGQMWVTDNLDASIEAFGGDADSPSERAHIEELREALDKTSGVTPAAAGHIKARVGNLTSENALRISLMGTIAKTKRKRVTYGAGIAALCELILHGLDVYGLLATRPEDRRVDVVWRDPIATDESRRIADALAKAELGVPGSILRAELGYPDSAGGQSQPARG